MPDTEVPAVALCDILDPLTADEFFRDYHGQKPLYLPGAPEKFAFMMSWARLNAMLDMTSIWSAASLQLFLDADQIAADRYCRPTIDRNGLQVMQPDPERVEALLRQGASLVCADIDGLNPGLKAVAGALEEGIEGKAQANLYCSWRAHPAFAAHFDTHDAFALHVEGEKVWRVYEGRQDNPIAHPRFKHFSREFHEQAKGALMMEARMTPGDLLYLPRGQYHEALASSAACVHVTFGVTSVIGLDVISALFERAVAEPLFRANLPRLGDEDGERAFESHLHRLVARLGDIALGAEVIDHLKGVLRAYRYPRGDYDLPHAAVQPRYRVRAKGLKVVRRGGGWGLKGEAAAVAIPKGVEGLVAWVIERDRFTRDEMAAAFPETPEADRVRMLSDLADMKVIEAA